jgi:hypothetical protein
MIITPGTSYANLQVTFDIKFSDNLKELDKKIRKKLPGTMRRIAMEGKSFWKAEAARKLRSSRNAYMDGINMQVVDETSFYLYLEGYIPYSVEVGNTAFDMKPGFLKNALKVKRKIPRAVAAGLPNTSKATMYKVIPLNEKRYINGKPTKFVTVTDASPAGSFLHPGFKGMHIADEVMRQLTTVIVPRHMKKLLENE